MKKIIFLLVLIGLFSVGQLSATADSGFCSGYQNGYAAGWCYQDNFCIPPIAPLCPIPRIGENGYQDGYNRGLVDGMQARSRRP